MFKILIITIFLVLSPAVLTTNEGSAGMHREQGSQNAAAATTSDRILDKDSQSTTALALAQAQAKEEITSLKKQLNSVRQVKQLERTKQRKKGRLRRRGNQHFLKGSFALSAGGGDNYNIAGNL